MQKSIQNVLLTAAAAVALNAGAALANEQQHGQDQISGQLDHVFVIMMENQTSTDILGNSNAPFINKYAKIANQATRYFAVGHPSAPNYLEIVGGSNFGLTNDFWPSWVHGGCVENDPTDQDPVTGGCVGAITPIATPGLDNPVPATGTPGTTSDAAHCNGQIEALPTPTAVANNCALRDYQATTYTPKTIADQLVAAHKTWKSYQEDLPAVDPGVDGVNYSDGEVSNLSPAAVFAPGHIQKLYAVKHNPFVYFKNIQLGTNPSLSFQQVVDFDGPRGLWADLASGDVPNLAFIAPNQCHDQHGFVSGGTPICASGTDVSNDAEAAATGELLLAQGDAEVNKLVNGIHASRAWQEGRNAIVVVWDENDFANAANNVVMLVETNYARNGNTDATPYDHFSLLKTLETGFGLPCLNHACDPTSVVMAPMFGFETKGNGNGNGQGNDYGRH